MILRKSKLLYQHTTHACEQKPNPTRTHTHPSIHRPTHAHIHAQASSIMLQHPSTTRPNTRTVSASPISRGHAQSFSTPTHAYPTETPTLSPSHAHTHTNTHKYPRTFKRSCIKRGRKCLRTWLRMHTHPSAGTRVREHTHSYTHTHSRERLLDPGYWAVALSLWVRIVTHIHTHHACTLLRIHTETPRSRAHTRLHQHITTHLPTTPTNSF